MKKKIPVNLLRILADLSQARRELEDLLIEEVKIEQAANKIYERKEQLQAIVAAYLDALAKTPLRGPEIEFPLRQPDASTPPGDQRLDQREAEAVDRDSSQEQENPAAHQ